MSGHYCKWLMLGLMLIASPLNAYWSETHKKFADAALEGNTKLSSIEKTESMADYYTNRLGFPLEREYIFDNIDELFKSKGFITHTIPGDKMSGVNIFIQGSDDEDLPTLRATNHFFDPTHNQSLRQSISERGEYAYQFDDLSAGISAWWMEAIKAPDWALEDNAEAPGYEITDPDTGILTTVAARQNHSLRDSCDYLYKALTKLS